MDVYIEYVIIDNMTVDYILLYLTCKISGFKVRILSLLCAAALGTVLALGLPMLQADYRILFLFKIVVGIAIYTVAAEKKKFKHYLNGLIVFFCLTFLMGGACLGLLNLLGSEIKNAITLNYSASVPIGIIILPIFLMSLFSLKLIKFIERRRNIYPFLRTVKLYLQNGCFEFKGFIDTGNRIYDGKMNPVCIITYNGAVKIFESEILKMYLFGKENAYIEFSGADGKKNKILSFYAQKIDIINSGQIVTHENVAFGILMKEFQDAEKYDILLNPSLIV